MITVSKERLTAALLCAAALLISDGAIANEKAADICAEATFDSDPDEDAKPAKGKTSSEGTKIPFAGACAKITGTVSATHQNNLTHSLSGLPVIISSRGRASNSRSLTILEADLTVETLRKTSFGDLQTTFSSRWAKADDDESRLGAVSVQELQATIAGWTIGYTDSLMNFWSEDFLFSATAPKRTVGIVSYSRDLADALKLAVAIESGLPTSRQRSEGIASLEFSAPIVTARVLYEDDDDRSVHLSGLLRPQSATEQPSILALGPAESHTGWAISFGATFPVKLLGEKDYVSGQTTYAVNASPFLGTLVDLSVLASIFPSATSKGWSAVGSYHHEWSDQWETNIFASYLALDANLFRVQPTIRTLRSGINVYWRPLPELRLGAELGRVDIQLGERGSSVTIKDRAYVGYLNAQWSF